MLGAMIPLTVWAIAGTCTVRALAFPLAYLFFAIPFGEFLVPTLMDWTANFTIAALRATGVPVFREGTHFAIPTGRWSVIEECSGINYLIASLAIGTLYAHLIFRSLRRRLAFVAASIAIPLLANGLRAYLIVLIAHLTQNRLATGIDHIVLGWFLFGGVVALMFWGASRLPPERHGGSTAPLPLSSPETASPRLIVVAAAAVVGCVTIWPVTARIVDHPLTAGSSTIAPLTAVDGWVADGGRFIDWTPGFANPSATLTQGFTKNGESVNVAILLYRNQGAASQGTLITTANQLVRSTDNRWSVVATSQSVRVGSNEVNADSVRFVGQGASVLAWHWFWVDGKSTASRAVAKWREAIARLSGRGGDGALVVIYSVGDETHPPQPETLARFAADMGAEIDDRLERSTSR
jgi:EpsI family protein